MILPPPELVAGILALPPRERLVSLYACRFVFAILADDAAWRGHISACCAELRPSRAERQALVEAAARVAGDLRAALGRAA